MLDVIVDPIALPQPSYLFGTGKLRADLVALLPAAVAGAQRDWERGSTYEGMLEIIHDIRERHTNCFDFRNHTQLPLASAFLLAQVGKIEAAERELESYLAGNWLKDAAAKKLRQLLRESAGPA